MDGLDSRISLRRLEVFVHVVEQGGVTRAAERLMVAQPAVSAQLRSLEGSLRAPLFARSKNALVLTEAGERVYRWAKGVLAGGAELQRTVGELAAGTAGSVDVVSSMAMGTYLVPPILLRLRTERPGAVITVGVDQPARALRSVQLAEADFAVLTWVDDVVPDGLSSERLWDEPLVLCASPQGPPFADSVEPADLAALPAVGTPPDVALTQMVARQLRALGGELHSVIHLGHVEAMKRAVVELGAVAVCPRYAVTRELARGELREVRIADGRLVETIGLYHREGAHFSPLQHAAVDAVRRGRPT